MNVSIVEVHGCFLMFLMYVCCVILMWYTLHLPLHIYMCSRRQQTGNNTISARGYIKYFFVFINLEMIERSGSGVERWTLDYENPGSNPVLRC